MTVRIERIGNHRRPVSVEALPCPFIDIANQEAYLAMPEIDEVTGRVIGGPVDPESNVHSDGIGTLGESFDNRNTCTLQEFPRRVRVIGTDNNDRFNTLAQQRPNYRFFFDGRVTAIYNQCLKPGRQEHFVDCLQVLGEYDVVKGRNNDANGMAAGRGKPACSDIGNVAELDDCRFNLRASLSRNSLRCTQGPRNGNRTYARKSGNVFQCRAFVFDRHFDCSGAIAPTNKQQMTLQSRCQKSRR